MKNTVVFVLSYLFFMALSYIWPWASNIGMLGALGNNSNSIAGIAVGAKFLGSLIIYIIMTIIVYIRGSAIQKKYIAAFPVVAGFFDLVLVFIPFVPTVMNIITLVMGVMNDKSNSVVK